MLESFNLEMFSLLNAPVDANPVLISFARFAAEKLLFAQALVMILLWLWASRRLRHALVAAVVTVVLALLVNALIGGLWHHPRPFVIGVGQQYLEHAPDSSFPSDHGTLMFSVAFGLLFCRGGRVVGVFALITALLVAWSRIYLGIHWPLDMLGAMGVSVLVAFLVTRVGTGLTGRLSDLLNTVFEALVARFH